MLICFEISFILFNFAAEIALFLSENLEIGCKDTAKVLYLQSLLRKY